MSMDERMTICNMSIGGRRARRLRQPGRYDREGPFAPEGGAVRADGGLVEVDGVGWECGLRRRRGDLGGRVDTDRDMGCQPGPVDWRPRSCAGARQRPAIRGGCRRPELYGSHRRTTHRRHESRRGVHRLMHQCTPSDLREAARIVKGKHVARHVKALVVPGSVGVARSGGARRDWTRCFEPRGSNGATPGARCAWA